MSLKSLLTNLSQRNSPTNIAQHRASSEAHKQKASGWLALFTKPLLCRGQPERKVEKLAQGHPRGSKSNSLSSRAECLPPNEGTVSSYLSALWGPSWASSLEYNCFNLEPAIHWTLTIVSLTPSLLSLTYVSNLPLFKAFYACGRQSVSIDSYYQCMSLQAGTHFITPLPELDS